MGTGDAPDNQPLSERIAVLEGRMETRQAEYESALDRLRADMAAHREDMARRDAASAERDAARSERDAARAERDATARWWQTAILIAAIAALITFAPDLRRLVAGP